MACPTRSGLEIALVAAICAVPLPLAAAEVYWRGVARVAEVLYPEQPAGEKAVLDGLEQRSRDTLGKLKHPADREQWQHAVPELRRRFRATLGLDRLRPPEARKLQVVGLLDRGDYVIEKLVYETFPGCRVAAHVYRPAKVAGRLPAILRPPGHSWEEGKSHPDTQAFGITMARWGFLVLVFEPHGEGERGVSMRDHRRTEMLLVGLCQETVPVYESQCALEYLLSRPDVDPARVGITGESGGGYNTWIMSTLDPRLAVAVPVVGTSDFYEQVQACRSNDFYLAREHCHFVPGLFRFANNHEFLALAAPRPVLVISAHNDQSFPIPGIRQVVSYGRQLYKALGKPEQLGYFEDARTGHGYQKPKREAAYGWFRRWLQQQGSGEPIAEPAVETLPANAAELRCFPPGRNEAAGPALIGQVQRLIEQLPAQSDDSNSKALRSSLSEALGIELATEAPQLRRGQRRAEGGAIIERLEVQLAEGVTLPALLVGRPGPWRGAVLAAADGGKESLLHHPGIQDAIEAGLAAAVVDVRGVGELKLRKPGFVFAVSLLLGENFVGRQALDLCAFRRALAQLPQLRDRPIGVFGSGPFAAQAALYAAALDDTFAWLAVEGGFLSFRSFVDRPAALQASYRLSPTSAAAWDVIDREIPAALYVYNGLHRFDLPDLLASLSPRLVLVAGPIDGEYRPLEEKAVVLLNGRLRGSWRPQLAVGPEQERRLRAFLAKRAANGE